MSSFVYRRVHVVLLGALALGLVASSAALGAPPPLTPPNGSLRQALAGRANRVPMQKLSAFPPANFRSQSQASTTRQIAQTSPQTVFTAEQKRAFLELHAEYYREIKERRDALSAKLVEIHEVAGTIPGSTYLVFRLGLQAQAGKMQERIGPYGSYTITFADRMELRVPDERQLDFLVDSLESVADQFRQRADERDNEAMEDLADQLRDLVEEADRLEGRLTRKTNALKRKWQALGGQVSYF